MTESVHAAFVASSRQYGGELFPGCAIKIDGQIRAFRDAGIECDLVVVPARRSRLAKIARRLPWTGDGVEWRRAEVSGYDAIYTRRPGVVTAQYIRWLKGLKERNPKLKILYEIPTYPYEKEMREPKMLPFLLKDRMYRGRLKRYVDRVIDLTGTTEIFGVPTLQIWNGIDLQAVRARAPKESDGRVHIMCIATFNEWHGIDRLLAGMANYQDAGGGREVVLHLVGEGPAFPALKGYVAEHGLGRHVVLHGRMAPDEFDSIYDNCHLAIECLGNHRKGILISSSLKSREYLAKGMPFAYSGEIDVFRDDPVDFCLRLPADESPVDIGALLDFVDLIYSREDAPELVRRIREYAERHVSMDAAMSSVTNYLNELSRT